MLVVAHLPPVLTCAVSSRKDTVSQQSSEQWRTCHTFDTGMVRTMQVDHAVVAGAALDVELEEESSLTAARTCGTGLAHSTTSGEIAGSQTFCMLACGVDVSGLGV